MAYSFTTPDFDRKNLLKNDISGINPFLLENNSKQVNLIYDFLEYKRDLLLVNGYMGTGKYSLVRHVLQNTDNIVLYYNCFETTILDDILLTFFEEFKGLAASGKIETPKAKSENFTQKINSYFESVKNPIVVVINSFEEVLKANRTEILGFVKHLCALPNVKVIMIARTFEYEEIEIPYDKLTILALEKPLFEKYLRARDFKQIGPLSDELYKHTRGYFLYVTLSMNVMQSRKLDLLAFLDGFSKSFVTFNDFIIREALAFVDPVSGHLFRFLTMMRHPVSIKLLKTLHLYDEEKVNMFAANLILSKEDDCLYLQDYYKVIAENSIAGGVAIKLHQGCVDLYNTQLPLKPLERDLLISRQTMRNEIEFHSMFIPQKPVLIRDITKEAEYTDYSLEAKSVQPVEEKEVETKEQTDEKIKKMSFIFDEDEFGVLDKIANSIKDYMSYSEKRAQQEAEDNKLNLVELINHAKQEEANFNFKHSTELYIKALAQKTDENYYTYLPTIYERLSYGYQQLSDWFNAQKYCEMADEFYTSAGNFEKSSLAKYNLANIFYMTFKKEEARETLKTLDRTRLSADLRIKVLNLMANLDGINAYKYYKEALEINPVNIDKNVLSELYYKFAVCCEDRAEDELAAKYYKMCISLKSTPYLADALSNLALLYDDIGERELAIKYYVESLKVYQHVKNFNGMYSSSMKLAEIYSSSDYEMTVEYYNKALAYAKELKEDFYVVSTNIAIGDLYFNRKENLMAYEHYKTALNMLKNSNDKDNINKIMMRMDDIKLRIGEEKFNELEK